MSSVIFVAQIVCVAIGWMLAHSTGGQARHCPLKDLGARLRIEGLWFRQGDIELGIRKIMLCLFTVQIVLHASAEM